MNNERLLKGKNILLTGVANKHSIAWAIALRFQAAGARLAFSCQSERFLDKTRKLADGLIEDPIYLLCDASKDDNIAAMAESLDQKWDRLDGFVHSIAFARREELGGSFSSTSREGFRLAHDISSYSLTAMTAKLSPLMAGGGSIITLTFNGSQRVFPNYNIMGVAKASLEASVRYLASDQGPSGIRVNALSAGPIKTVSAKGVKDFNSLLENMEQKTPLRRLATANDVAGTALFLASDLSGAVTGTVTYVDCGYHIMGA